MVDSTADLTSNVWDLIDGTPNEIKSLTVYGLEDFDTLSPYLVIFKHLRTLRFSSYSFPPHTIDQWNAPVFSLIPHYSGLRLACFFRRPARAYLSSV